MKRTRIFIVCAFCILVALSGRLLYIQVVQGSRLQFLAAEQWYRDLPLGARRGNILDRNGNIMAQSIPTYSIYVRPVAVTNPERVADVLSNILNISHEMVYRRATSKGASEWLLKMQVEKELAMRIVSHNLDGVFLSQTFKRTYPLGHVGGQVLGMVSIDNIGQEGIESFYNRTLAGRDGRIATPSDLRGIPRRDGVDFFTPSIPGMDIVLNVDATKQNILQSALARALYEHNALSAGGIIYCIQTGGILASASAPFFDMNNQPRDNVLELLDGIRNMPILNVFEPGSTFKVLTLAIAIEEGLIEDGETFNCPGFRMIGGERVRCWRTKGHGTQTLEETVKNSCNASIMDLAQRIGVERYYEYLRRFGIGTKTGVDFYGESAGLVLPQRYVRPVDLARIGFGQAIAVSPIQFISTFSALVGDGVLRTPRFANSIPTMGTNVSSPIRGQQVISPQTSARVRELLYGVVSAGSGKHSAQPGFHIGGKTGTAQKYIDGVIAQGRYVSSFVSFMTYGGIPRYAVFFYVDEPSRMGYYGSIVAAPYVGEIWQGIIEYLGLQPDSSLLPTNTPAPVAVPSVSGMQTFEAVALLRKNGFFVQVSGDGFTSTGTFPEAGTVLKRGAPVVVRTQ
ncbi:MAG: penicillin-binding transpeptidase domain-containing protein [Firmicutes bacterium]|nr:penicillin-binding transpeptidase domain-containing protein [Bacillota bacterium]